MTAEEIKQQYSMRDVVEMYGFHLNKAGFISCPFHSGDHSPSMKIYQKDFHCHACGANGDIFTFVQRMDNCSFKDAFLKLGGEYEHKTDWQRKNSSINYNKRKRKKGKNWSVSGNGREKYCRTYQCKSYLLNVFQFFR